MSPVCPGDGWVPPVAARPRRAHGPTEDTAHAALTERPRSPKRNRLAALYSSGS